MPSHKSKASGSSPKKYALVKWLSGKEKGTLMHNLSTEWIRDFSDTDNFDESYIVEWRVPPQPKNGWQLYDAKVLEVSDDDVELKRLMKEYESSEDDVQSLITSPACKSTPQTSRTPHMQRTPVFNSASLSSRDDLKQLIRTLLSSGDQSITLAGSSGSISSEEDHVKVGKALSIPRSCFVEANTARSGSIMTMNLVKAAFSARRLRKSTYAGQKRTTNGNTVIKPGLKKYRRMRDIQTFVSQRFPHFSQSNFCNAVNSVTGKNVDKQKKAEYVDVSDSSDSDEMSS